MTIICVRDGIMAADTGVFADDLLLAYQRKIVRGPSGSLAAAAGPFNLAAKFRSWIESGEESALGINTAEEMFGALILRPSGDILQVGHDSAVIEVFAPFFAEGRGRSFAMGAMAAGASAEEAARLCIEKVENCGGEVQVEHLCQSSVRAA